MKIDSENQLILKINWEKTTSVKVNRKLELSYSLPTKKFKIIEQNSEDLMKAEESLTKKLQKIGLIDDIITWEK